MAFRSPLAPKAARHTKGLMPIIDCHTHIWNISKWNSPWLKDFPALNKSLWVSDYQEETKYLNIKANVFVETNPVANDFTKETKLVTEVCESKQNTFQAIVGSCDIQSPALPNHVNQFTHGRSKQFFRGVRDVAHGKPSGYLTSQQAIENYQYLGSQGLIFEVLCQPDELINFVPVVRACVNTKFVIDHCGGIQGLKGDKQKEDRWKLAIDGLSQSQNVVLKVSGFAGGWGNDPRVDQMGWHFDLQRDYIEFAMGAFDANNQIFGLDWPLNKIVPGITLEAYINGVEKIAKQIGRDLLVKKLFYINAMKTFNFHLESSLESLSTELTVKEVEERFATMGKIHTKWNKLRAEDQTFLEAFNNAALVSAHNNGGLGS